MTPDHHDREMRQRRFRIRARIFAGSFLVVCVLLGVAYVVARSLQAG